MKKTFMISALILPVVCLWPTCAYALGFTIATAAGLVAATAAGGVGLTGVGLAVGAGITGALAYGGVKAFSSMTKQPETSTQPAALPPPPSVDKAAVEAKESIDKKRRAVSRNKTIFTSPFGLNEEDKSGLATKTLLGE